MRNAALTLSANFIRPSFNIIGNKKELPMPDMHKIYVQSQPKESSIAMRTPSVKKFKFDNTYVQAKRAAIVNEIYAKRDALMGAVQHLDQSFLFKKKGV